ncbi:hypothetical protein AB6A40_002635 [Gnathostoma spinigerum]|uniref:Striatin N-terminal domain-containing protein n=1 Tax=Gnathostoma spinigerum TaxID=75299 RepID=A0ABD6EEU4_9BILA
MVNIGAPGFAQQTANPNVSSVKMNSKGGEGTNGSEYQSMDRQDPNISDGKPDEVRRVPYTMHGVLHYLQHEWSRYEMERAQWEMERAELQARISFLQGERKGQENLKSDLIRRIKMLEYCLKQERAKNYRLTHNGQEPQSDDVEDKPSDELSSVPLDVDAYAKQGNNEASWVKGRALLRQYLQEIGYSETVLDVRSFRVKNLLGLAPQTDWMGADPNSDYHQAASRALQDSDNAAMGVADFLSSKSDEMVAPIDESDSDEDDILRKGRNPGLCSETMDALKEFTFLKDEKSTGSKKRGEGGDDWSVDRNAIDQLKQKFRTEQARKRSNSQSDSNSAKSSLQQTYQDQKRDESSEDGRGMVSVKHKKEYMDINAFLGITDDVNLDIKDDFAMADDDTTAVRWNLKFTLRSHFDSIRVMQFHPVEPVLITASEDGTAKLWNLGGPSARSESNKGGSLSVTESEPTYTFRGHNGPVLSMDMSPTGDMCYTGGFDGIICCWCVPSVNTDIYEPFDPKVLNERLKGHSDAVWSIAYHSSDNHLVSASADGTIRLWEPGNFENVLLKTFGPPAVDLRPTSVDFVSTEPQQLLTAYNRSYASILDMETARTVLTFDFANENAGCLTKILSHPTMPVTVTAGDDRRIRYFDNNTGKLIHGTVAHVEAISSLAIDPNGLYLLSGSHDGSLRLWNMEKRICLQEIAAHRKKYDSSVMSVAFHPSRSLIGSAGADGLAKVFSCQKIHSGSFNS